jgi:hypothetical protein
MSHDPTRLRDDAGARPSLRDDLAIARRGARVPYEQAKGLARLQASLGGGGPGSGSGGSSPGAPSSGGLAPPIPWGSAALGAGAAAVVLALWSVLVPSRDSSPRTASLAVESAVAASPASAPAPLASSIPALDLQASSRPAPPASPPHPLSPIAPAAARSSAGLDSPAPTPDLAASVVSASKEATLAEEVAQLARLRALVASDPASAVALAEEGHHRFSGGALWLERESLALDALERLGRREEAATRAARVLQRYPDGPSAERLRRHLGPQPDR